MRDARHRQPEPFQPARHGLRHRRIGQARAQSRPGVERRAAGDEHAAVGPDHQRGRQNPPVLQADGSAVLGGIERLGNRGAEKGDVVLALQAFPELQMHQIGLAYPRQFANSALEGTETQFATCVPMYLHLCNRGEARVVQVRPYAKVRKKCRAGRAVGVNSLVPTGWPSRRPVLDQRNLEMTAAKRYRQGSASKAAADDDEIEFHVIPD